MNYLNNREKLKNKYKLLVLIDLSVASYTALKNAVNLAKTIDGNINIFYVKQPVDVVKHENQISAMRVIVEENNTTKKKLDDIVSLISEEENIPISYDFAFGNIKNEIKSHIDKTDPDIVVLGRRKQNLVNFLGDGLTQFLLTNHTGVLLIAGGDKKLLPHNDISFGFFSDTIDDLTIEITKDLSKNNKTPIKFFSIQKRSSTTRAKSIVTKLKSVCNIKDAIEYEFEEGINALDGLVTYVSKNNMELLCMGRKKENWTDKITSGRAEIKKLIQKLNIPLLIIGNKEHTH